MPIASLAPPHILITSVSMEERAIRNCNLEDQETGAELRKQVMPEVDFLWDPQQSWSQ